MPRVATRPSGLQKKVFAKIDATAVITPNNFKFKSLSEWSYNIAQGCQHGCSFCYVPSSATIRAEQTLECSGLVPKAWRTGRINKHQHWGDIHWGEYCFLRTWNKEDFLASLKSAERKKKLTPDGNRAIMLCTTTDPYQTFTVPGNKTATAFLNGQRKLLVRNALELILQKSTLNVRILTRSPLAQQDFDLYKEFGNRLTFGMSLPTLNDKLSRIYEPHAPGPLVKLHTLQEAVAAGLHVFVALAPTFPDEAEDELRATMTEIVALEPITIFHEPINLRAENIARIENQARLQGKTVKTDVLKTRARWREYAFQRFALIEKIAQDLKVPKGVIHQWPDEDLASKSGFMQMKRMQAERDFKYSGFSKSRREFCEKEWEEETEPWFNHWHNPEERISSWPGVFLPKWK